MDKNWAFKCFVSTGERDLIDEWYSAQDGKARGAIDAVLEILAVLPRDKWARPEWAPLTGTTCKELSEVRAKPDRRQLRIVGYFGAPDDEYILLTAFQKQRQSDTNKACAIAQKRKKEVVNDPCRRTTICVFP